MTPWNRSAHDALELRAVQEDEAEAAVDGALDKEAPDSLLQTLQGLAAGGVRRLGVAGEGHEGLRKGALRVVEGRESLAVESQVFLRRGGLPRHAPERLEGRREVPRGASVRHFVLMPPPGEAGAPRAAAKCREARASVTSYSCPRQEKRA